MSVGVRVGRVVDVIGTPAFLNAFFSTLVAVLEDGERGARFPALTTTLYAGELPADRVAAALAELRAARDELAMHPPGDVVWDLDDAAARPPWGDDISSDITSLADYFVTETGRDLVEVLLEALDRASGLGARVTVEVV